MGSDGAAGLLGRVGAGFFQQAYVVADLEAAQDAFRSALGCARFNNLPATPLPYRYRGRAVECALALAFGRSGDVQIELIQPVSGEGTHVDFLAARGPGAHHLGFLVDDVEAELEASRAGGVDELMSGQFGSLRFAYLDTVDLLGVFVELVEDPDGIMQTLTP
ncbi:MAG: VOC family protein [Acidimicrobiia bacterium]